MGKWICIKEIRTIETQGKGEFGANQREIRNEDVQAGNLKENIHAG